MKKLAIVFVLSLIWSACENEPIEPENLTDKVEVTDQEETEEEPNDDEAPLIEEQIKGKWLLEKYESTVCTLSTAECSTMELNAGEGDYFEFKNDTVEVQFYGALEKYPLEIISDDSLAFKGFNISEYFIIKNLTENKMTLSFYMDHTNDQVNDDNDITDSYYLSKE